MDVFDLFEDSPQQYGIQTWQYAKLDRIVGPGDLWDSIAEAKSALCIHLHIPLEFEDIRVGMEAHASHAYEHHLDIAVVYRLNDSEIMAQAPMVG